MNKNVYLAGAIKGLNYKDSTDWREYAKQELAKDGIVGVSPMRAKEFLESAGVLEEQYNNHVLTCQIGIVARDRYDVKNCDLMLANLLGLEKVTIGTMIEYGWTDAFRKPIITVIEKEGNIHDHYFVRELTGFRVETLDEGIYVAKAILTY